MDPKIFNLYIRMLKTKEFGYGRYWYINDNGGIVEYGWFVYKYRVL